MINPIHRIQWEWDLRVHLILVIIFQSKVNNNALSFLAMIFLFSSCNKVEDDQNYPTNYPLPYLPVYPGSDWTYMDEDGDTIIYKTESNYILHSYYSAKLHGAETEPVYVPVWRGMPIYGYSTPTESQYNSGIYYQSIIVSEIQGTITYYHYDNHGYYGWSTVAFTDTSTSVNNLYFENVIVIADSSGSGYHQNEKLRGYKYYAKDVGLIKIESVDSVVHQKLGIISYHINH